MPAAPRARPQPARSRPRPALTAAFRAVLACLAGLSASSTHAAPPAGLERARVRVTVPVPMLGVSWSLALGAAGADGAITALVQGASRWRVDVVAGRANVIATTESPVARVVAAGPRAGQLMAVSGATKAFMDPVSGIHLTTGEPRDPPGTELVVPATSASPVPACEALRAAGGRGLESTTAAPNGLGLFQIGADPTVYLARLERRSRFVGHRFRSTPDTCSAAGHRDCFMARRALLCDVRDAGSAVLVVSRVEAEGVADCWRRDVGNVAAEGLALATDGTRIVVGWLQPAPRGRSQATFLTLDGTALAARCAPH